MLLIGEAFVYSSEDMASEYCQNKLEVLFSFTLIQIIRFKFVIQLFILGVKK